VTATYCIDYRVLSCVPARVYSNEDVTVELYLHVQQVPRAYLPPTWTEPTYSQQYYSFCGVISAQPVRRTISSRRHRQRSSRSPLHARTLGSIVALVCYAERRRDQERPVRMGQRQWERLQQHSKPSARPSSGA
jgi:hypothetical protein